MSKPESSASAGISPGTNTDIGELAALFSTQSGGRLPAEVSADLALEIVLNEIVEQACLATGATGAAVLLERNGEMMCRASSGANAPELGARVGNSGLTAECIKTREVQRCDDALADPRVDAEASRNLGVRSVMVLPLLRNGLMAGVLEVFSSRPQAFRERDEITLEVLARQILKNMERANQPFAVREKAVAEVAAPLVADQGSEEVAADFRPGVVEREAVDREAVHSKNPDSAIIDSGIEDPILHYAEQDISRVEVANTQPAIRWVTLALSAAVLGCSVLLAILVGYRLGWRKIAAAKGAATVEPQAKSDGPTHTENLPGPDLAGSSAAVADSAARKVETRNAPASTAAAHGNESGPPEGGLAVYEDGKEIFSLPPGGKIGADGSQKTAWQKKLAKEKGGAASAVVPAGIVELSPEAAAGSLLHRVEPKYPEEARQQKIQGAVVLEVRIGRDGGIQDVRAIRGQSLLADAAMAAVKQWRFRPQMRSGKPVEMQTRVTLNFRLPG